MIEYGDAFGNPGAQAQALAQHGLRIGEILRTEYARSFDVFGQRLIDMAAKEHPHRLEKKEADTLFMRIARAWILAKAAQQVTAIIGTTRKQATAIIQRETETGYAAGLGQREVARMIQTAIREEGGALARRRAEVIARTETHNAANVAAHEAVASTGLPIVKEWVAAVDGRERETHAAADGQTVALHEAFNVGGVTLMYPGDANGPAEEVINCRCAVAHTVAD